MESSSVNIAVLVSGGGTNLAALIKARRAEGLAGGEIRCVVSSRPGAYALTRAEENGIDGIVVSKKDYLTAKAFDSALIAVFEKYQIDLIVLAGYMNILSENITEKYDKRIINIHPSLIPSFCGAGFYGLKVHEAALNAGVKITGATAHYVNEIPDGGEIILQKAVEVLPGDTPEILQKRVMEQAEWIILPEAVRLACRKITDERMG